MSPSPPTAGRVGVGSPPPSARAGPLPVSSCQQGRGGAGGRLRVFKGSLRRLLSSKLTAFSSWTPVTMWLLTLFLALSLGGTGEMTGKWRGRGQSPDSHAAFSPGNPFPFSPHPSCTPKHFCPAPCLCTLPSPSQSSFPYQAPVPSHFPELLLFSPLTISGLSSLAKEPSPLQTLAPWLPL